MPAQAGIQAVSPRQSAFFLDSRFRGNDASFFHSAKNLPFKGQGSGIRGRQPETTEIEIWE